MCQFQSEEALHFYTLYAEPHGAGGDVDFHDIAGSLVEEGMGNG